MDRLLVMLFDPFVRGGAALPRAKIRVGIFVAKQPRPVHPRCQKSLLPIQIGTFEHRDGIGVGQVLHGHEVKIFLGQEGTRVKIQQIQRKNNQTCTSLKKLPLLPLREQNERVPSREALGLPFVLNSLSRPRSFLQNPTLVRCQVVGGSRHCRKARPTPRKWKTGLCIQTKERRNAAPTRVGHSRTQACIHAWKRTYVHAGGPSHLANGKRET